MKNNHRYIIALFGVLSLFAAGALFKTLRQPEIAPAASSPLKTKRDSAETTATSSGTSRTTEPAISEKSGTADAPTSQQPGQSATAARQPFSGLKSSGASGKGDAVEVRNLGPVEPAALNGEMATASTLVGNTRYNLSPNQIGVFPRVAGLEPHQTLPVEVSYRNASPGDKVVVEAEDGGHFDNKKVVKVADVGSNKSIQFDFTTGSEEGVYRITLRKGADVKTLDFWVGAELQARN
jgi:hypothetical protein